MYGDILSMITTILPSTPVIPHGFFSHTEDGLIASRLDFIDYMRFTTVLVWGGCILFNAYSWFTLIFRPKKARVFDIVRVAFSAHAFTTVSFTFRWYIAQDSVVLYGGLYLFSIITGLGTILVCYRYKNMWEPTP